MKVIYLAQSRRRVHTLVMMMPNEKTNAKVMAMIQSGKAVSASRHWMVLSSLAMAGELTDRVAPNGQLEFLCDGKPVLIGP